MRLASRSTLISLQKGFPSGERVFAQHWSAQATARSARKVTNRPSGLDNACRGWLLTRQRGNSRLKATCGAVLKHICNTSVMALLRHAPRVLPIRLVAAPKNHSSTNPWLTIGETCLRTLLKSLISSRRTCFSNC